MKIIFQRLFVLLVCAILPLGMMAQLGKKPRIMVVPSDALLHRMGLLSERQNLMGGDEFVQHYERAFLDNDLKAAVTKFDEMMVERNFPSTKMEFELKRVKDEFLKAQKAGKSYAPVIPIDIRVDLNYDVKVLGPRKTIYFEITAIDAYSNKPVASASGEGAPAIGANVVTLLQEAVLDKIGKFNDQLQTAFEALGQKGRETRVELSASGITFDDEVGSGSLADFVDAWLTANCVNKAFSVDSQDEENMAVSQAMMPLYIGEKAMDARTFYMLLAKELRAFGLTVKVRPEGLGKVYVEISR